MSSKYKLMSFPIEIEDLKNKDISRLSVTEQLEHLHQIIVLQEYRMKQLIEKLKEKEDVKSN